MEGLLRERYVCGVGFAGHDSYGEGREEVGEEVVEGLSGGGVIGGGVITIFLRFFCAGREGN